MLLLLGNELPFCTSIENHPVASCARNTIVPIWPWKWHANYEMNHNDYYVLTKNHVLLLD